MTAKIEFLVMNAMNANNCSGNIEILKPIPRAIFVAIFMHGLQVTDMRKPVNLVSNKYAGKCGHFERNKKKSEGPNYKKQLKKKI